jgi:hypothetical protein
MRLIAKNMIVLGCLHQLFDKAGVFIPISANMMLDMPTGADEEQNHDSDAQM